MKKTTALSIITVLLAILAVFQLALILGVPWGKAAWGGQKEVLPTEFRVASAINIIIYALVLWVARSRISEPERRGFRIAAWIIFAYFCLGVLLNLASRSAIERIWVPVTLLLSWAFFVVARDKKRPPLTNEMR